MLATQKPIQIVSEELYIEPISVCNLKCKMCYTNVINGPAKQIIPAERILSFVHRFAATTPPPLRIYWCGTGEIFLHPDASQMINEVAERYGDGVTQTIQTNGTVDRLKEIKDFSHLKFRVSIDGMKDAHEWHRGAKTYDRTVAFCRSVLDRGCAGLAVRTLLTRDNVHSLDKFHDELKERLGTNFLLSPMVPFNNRILDETRASSMLIVRGQIDDHKAVPEDEARAILAERYGDRFILDEDSPVVNNYLSLTTYGVYTCCNGVVKVGEVDDSMDALKDRMEKSETACRSCAMFPCM